MKKSYIVTKDVNSPVVVGSQTAHKPAQVRFRKFRKGQVVQGELKHANNKPSFVLVGAMCVVPIDCVKELTGKDIESNYTGADMDEQKEKPTVIKMSNPKIKYLDALLIGSAVGFLGVHLAEKQGYLTPNEELPMKNKLIGAGIVGLLAVYIVYRNQSTQTITKTKTND
jgi:hypothetical protein